MGLKRSGGERGRGGYKCCHGTAAGVHGRDG